MGCSSYGDGDVKMAQLLGKRKSVTRPAQEDSGHMPLVSAEDAINHGGDDFFAWDTQGDFLKVSDNKRSCPKVVVRLSVQCEQTQGEAIKKALLQSIQVGANLSSNKYKQPVLRLNSRLSEQLRKTGKYFFELDLSHEDSTSLMRTRSDWRPHKYSTGDPRTKAALTRPPKIERYSAQVPPSNYCVDVVILMERLTLNQMMGEKGEWKHLVDSKEELKDKVTFMGDEKKRELEETIAKCVKDCLEESPFVGWSKSNNVTVEKVMPFNEYIEAYDTWYQNQMRLQREEAAPQDPVQARFSEFREGETSQDNSSKTVGASLFAALRSSRRGCF